MSSSRRPVGALIGLLGTLLALHVAHAFAAVVPSPSAPATLPHTIWGIDEQSPGLFDDPRWQALPLEHVRYFVPWDLRAEPRLLRQADRWMTAARRHHAVVLLALTQSDVPGRSHFLPSRATYRAAVRWIMRRYRRVREWTPWNEANLVTQATVYHPEIAALYWRVLTRLCPSCVVTSPSLVGYQRAPSAWLGRFLAAARGLHGPWALHVYNDVNEFTTRTLRMFQRVLRGPIWVTEVGGWQHFRGFPTSLRHQTRAVGYLFGIAPLFPRVERWYLYQWLGSPRRSVWDSGLLNHDGSARPALRVVEHYLLGSVPLPSF